jgi:radical SAM-linked protein
MEQLDLRSTGGRVEALQRLRLVFGKGAELKYISHLDLLRVWERVLRRARVPLAYSQGFNPRPKLFFAAALPVGCTGRAEMLDLLMEHRVGLHAFASSLKKQMPEGLELCSVSEVELTLPSLPSEIVAAEYEVRVQGSGATDAIQNRLDSLLAATSIPRSRQRPDGTRSYDLRPLVQNLALAGRDGDAAIIRMRLQADAHGTGRPDEVMAALEMTGEVLSMERLQLVFKRANAGNRNPGSEVDSCTA